MGGAYVIFQRPTAKLFVLILYIQQVDPRFIEFLQEYSWPGNVRELQNVIESAMNQCTGDILLPAHASAFKERLSKHFNIPAINRAQFSSSSFEQQELLATIQQYKGNKSKAAKALGISRATL